MGPAKLRVPPALRQDMNLLLQVAILVFVFTIFIGVLNGTDVVSFDNKAILAHVHSGTLGWITLCVLAAALWLFGPSSPAASSEVLAARVLAVAAMITIPALVVSFLVTYDWWRGLLGTFVLVDMVGFFVWSMLRARRTELTAPHLGVLAGLATSVVGGIIGVLWALQIGTGRRFLPEDAQGAHPGTMVVGFLIPVGMALAEWFLAGMRPERLTRAGALQIGFPFVGGLLVSIGLLLDIIPLVALSLPFEIIGVGIFLKRMSPLMGNIRWRELGVARHAAFTGLWLVVNLGLYIYFIVRYKADFDIVPKNEILALDHLMFIGVMTNVILALIWMAAVERANVLPWAEHVAVWGINLPLAIFAIGLFAGVAVFKQIFTPLIGLSLLVAIVAATIRLQAREEVLQPQPQGRPSA